jgi:hypothetical protein
MVAPGHRLRGTLNSGLFWHLSTKSKPYGLTVTLLAASFERQVVHWGLLISKCDRSIWERVRLL